LSAKPEKLLKRLRERVKRVRKPPLFSIPTVFALGSGGGRILAGVEVPETCWRIAVNSSQRDLDLIADNVNLTVPCGDGSGSQMNPRRGRQDVEEVLDFLVEAVNYSCEAFDFDIPDLIPVIATFGHGFGSGALEPVLRKLKKSFPRSVLMPFVVTPFKAEGSGIMRRAFNSLESVSKRFTCFPASNEVMSRNLKIDVKSLAISRVYNEINAEIQKTLSILFGSLTVREGVIQSFDRSDLFKIVDGELGTISMGRFKRAEDITIAKLKRVERREWLDTAPMKREEKPIETERRRKLLWKKRREEEKVSTKPKRRRRKLKATYIIDGTGKFTVKQLSDTNTYLKKVRNVDIKWLKPIIIERSKPCDLLLMKCGYTLKYGRNIAGTY